MEPTRAWPHPSDGGRAQVVLVARTHAVGLGQARAAAVDWAVDAVPWVDLFGLVLMADAPKLVPQLRPAITEVAAMVPYTWSLGWRESWRALTPDQTYPLDARAKQTVARIQRLNSEFVAQTSSV